MRILIANDDGIESPALLPTIEVLKILGEVEVVVPQKNQSWTSKSNTRKPDQVIPSAIHDIGGVNVIALDAKPADCSNYGLYMREQFPDLLVTGANLGHNLGLHAYLSSGTVGAALEGLIAGVPSIAISVGYNPGSEQIPDSYRKSLRVIPKLVEAFYHSRPKNVLMLTVNLVLGVDNSGFLATEMDRWSFGSLFRTKNNTIYARNYPDLNQSPPTLDNTDTWARKKNLNSVIGLDHMAQIVDKSIIKEWLIKNDLHYQE